MRGKKRCPVGLLAVVLGCASSNAGNGEDDGATSGAGDGGSGDAGSGDGGSTSGGGGSGGSGSDGSGASSGGSAGTTGGSGTDGSGPDGCSLADLLDEPTYDDMFLHREDPACEGGVYSYAGLLDAAAAHPKFACEGTGEQRLQEVAAFLAQIGHETTGGWPTAPDGPHAWGLCFVEEVGCAGGACTQYCDAGNAQYPCAPGKTYHGRGAIQLSWNYNYGQAGDALGVDILSDPDRVATDGELAISTALWFWMTEQLPKPSAHDVMVGNWVPDPADEAAGRLPGFGATTMIINGGIECTRPTPAAVEDRVGFYSSFCDALSVDTGENLYCDQMQPFG